MDTTTAATFFALLSIGCIAGSVVLLAARLRGGPTGTSVLAAVAPVRFHLGAAIALGATLGSLYMSEIAGFTPCEFCWYQRIAMYPLVVVLGVAAWKGSGLSEAAYAVSTASRLTATILAGIGTALSTYHVQLQRLPDQSSSCDPTAPCTAIWVDIFGVFTIPTMALTAFLAILTLMWAPSLPERS